MSVRATSSSSALDAFVPGAQFRDTIALSVQATTSRILRAAHEVTAADMPLALALGELRYLPGRLIGHGPPRDLHAAFLDGLIHGGNVVLAENDHELVIGMIGRLHQIVDQEAVQLHDRTAFTSFDSPGYEKLAMSLRVEEQDAGRRLLVFEHRTLAIGADAERRFRRYWAVIRPTGAFVTMQLLRAIRRRAERIAAPRIEPRAHRPA